MAKGVGRYKRDKVHVRVSGIRIGEDGLGDQGNRNASLSEDDMLELAIRLLQQVQTNKAKAS